LIELARKAGEFFAVGGFTAGYLEREGAPDAVLVGGGAPIVLEVTNRCPRDRLIRALERIKM
jgi:hypothetical protein